MLEIEDEDSWNRMNMFHLLIIFLKNQEFISKLFKKITLNKLISIFLYLSFLS